ncbi:MAG: metallophosphoesterase [Lentisphaeria bacterium]|nr:MAG: metallophosphoesterase [Lentisphaeria bacterium]
MLVLSVKRRRVPESFRIAGNPVNLILLALAAVLASIGIFCGTKLPVVRERTIPVAGLPAEAGGADSRRTGRSSRRRCDPLPPYPGDREPDQCAQTGSDRPRRGFRRWEGRGAEPGTAAAGELSARYGVFGVPGNHEYYSGSREWIAFLSSLGIQMLCNEHRFLPERNVAVAGVTDPAAARMGETPPDIEKALAGIPSGALKLLLAHQPGLAHRAAEAGVDIQLSGHTHGGMVRGVDRLVALFNGGFVSGLYQVGGMTLYLTNGTGIWSGFPVRLGVPSEIALLRFVGKEERSAEREAEPCPDTEA